MKKKCPGCEKGRKHLAYGQRKGLFWCSYCDAGHESPINKRSERQKAKREIRKELEECQILNVK